MSARRTCGYYLGLAALCLSFAGHASGDVGKMAGECDACHGKDGVSEFDDIPTVAGISAFAHSDALYVYREDGRPCAESAYRHGDTERPATTMCAIVQDMSDDDIDAIADYYAAKTFVVAEQEFDPALAEQGKAVHAEHCGKCHTDGGANADDDSGILAGQRMGYLRQSIADYLSGDRDQTKKMKVKMDKLGAQDAEALVHFYASRK